MMLTLSGNISGMHVEVPTSGLGKEVEPGSRWESAQEANLHAHHQPQPHISQQLKASLLR